MIHAWLNHDELPRLLSGILLHSFEQLPFRVDIYLLNIVIFHSYVSIPEGTVSFHSGLRYHVALEGNDGLEAMTYLADFKNCSDIFGIVEILHGTFRNHRKS